MKLMKMSSLLIGAAVVCAGLLADYSSAAESNPYAELTKVPAKESARANPLEHDPDAIAAGGKLYGMHCAECHGANAEGGKGKKKGPALRASEIRQATPGTLFWLLSNGAVRRGMPVWSKLPEPQRWQIVTYVKSLNASPAPQPANSGGSN
ncbi:MAG TPA: c-type cytochrome [Candidatus Sulfotelmatobacter sp.]